MIAHDDDDDDDDDDDGNELLLRNGRPTQPYFQSGPFSKALTMAGLRVAASRI